jgi:hypothetical protein
LVQEDQKR